MEADKLLKQFGYRIEGRQIRESVIINVDGKQHFGCIEADFIVSKNKKRFVVEVGNGTLDPTDPAVRRRLLEYHSAFRPDGFLLVNTENRKICEVSVKFPRVRDVDFYFQFLTALFIILIVVGIIWLMIQIKLF